MEKLLIRAIKALSFVLILMIMTIMSLTVQANAAPNAGEVTALALVNEQRILHGLQPLYFEEKLDAAADVRVREVSAIFSHTRPDGSQWWTADPELLFGENLAEGYNSPEDVVAAWMASPSHAENILKADFNSCAIKSYVTAAGKCIWVQEFGK